MNLLQIVLKFGTKHFGGGKFDFRENKEITNENVEDMFLHKINPRQIVSRLDQKPFEFFKVNYEYTTVYGNRRQGTKYFVFNSYSPEIDMKKELEHYVKEFNKENPKRKLLNVKFLSSYPLGFVELNK